jgi:hypothetical protein
MKSSGLLRGLVASCLVATFSAAFGQTNYNAYQLFTPANVRVSTNGTGTGSSANTFNTKTLNLSCPQTVRAWISSSPDASGNVLVDNYIGLSVNGANDANPINICKNGTDFEGMPNCFNTTYGNEASGGNLTGQNPDTFTASGGVPALDIAGSLQPGANKVQITTVDSGYFLTSSTLYLVTSCTSNGVSGSGNITGNPISSSSPTGNQLTQNYPVNSANDQQTQFTYDLTTANNAGTLNINNGSTPSSGDDPISQSAFQPYLKGTSFATAQCLTHSGNLVGGSAACVLFTLTCQVGTNPQQAGALCPVSQQKNENFVDFFDGPAFTLPDIKGSNGKTYHQGVGFLEAKEGWTGGTCTFDPNSAISGELCPQNTLTSFSGPGAYKSGGQGQSPNSTFITVAPVPEDLTTVTVKNQTAFNWVNTNNPTIKFTSVPPALSNSNFVAAPIASITYGFSSPSNVPAPPAPIQGDQTLSNGACPAPGSSFPKATPFSASPENLELADGQYVMHYYAQDCAGTQELKFTNSGGNWNTSFYTVPVNVDTVAPVVASGPTLSPASNDGSYQVGQKVTVSYRCTDERSGIVQCGSKTFSTPVNDTGVITVPVDTSKTGQFKITVNATDAAGNCSTPVSISYVVSPTLQPVNLFILKTAPPFIKRNLQLAYGIGVANLSRQTATSITVTDNVPAGLTLVKAYVQKGPNGSNCSTSGATATCTIPSMTASQPAVLVVVVNVTAKVGTRIANTATMTTANPNSGNSQSTVISTVF